MAEERAERPRSVAGVAVILLIWLLVLAALGFWIIRQSR
jgi:hypothetical protein